MQSTTQLSRLQLSIMRVLWDRGEATVSDVHEPLHAARGLATTTVATVLSRLEKRGVVAHTARGRQFVYRATVTEEAMCRDMVEELADRVFAGDRTALLRFALDSGEVGPDELDRLKSVIEERERDAVPAVA